MNRAAIASALRTIADALEEDQPLPAETADPWLDVVTLDKLVGRQNRRDGQRTGALRTVRIGRKAFTRQSWLDSYLEAMPSGAARTVPDEPEGDHIDALISARGWRRTG